MQKCAETKKQSKLQKIAELDLLTYERNFLSSGKRFIAGMDEAGRGPLAGPVVVACVLMPLEEKDIIKGVYDSKQLTPVLRDTLYEKIIEKAIEYHISIIDNTIIDGINILNATKKGMKECISAFESNCDMVLVDAVKLNDTKIDTLPIIKGDALSYSIAAASIIAKVTRDRIMEEYDLLFPQYGFCRHKGYATPEHINALKTYGACPLHRKSFIKNFFAEQTDIFENIS
jgi:ribonuclease HII